VPKYHIVDNMDHVAYTVSRPGIGHVKVQCDYDEAEGTTPAEAVRAWAEGFADGEGPEQSCTVWAVDTATGEHTRVRLTATWSVSYEAAELPPEPAP